MGNQYYYLEGKDQKGPFTLEQLENIGLRPDTLVWSESLDYWRPAKEVPELQNLIRKLPPPPPIIDSHSQQGQGDETKINPLVDTFVEDSNVKFWVTLKVTFIIILFVTIFSLIGYLLVENKKAGYRNEIGKKIEYVFNGKSVVLDGTKSGVQGETEETGYTGKTKSDIFRRWWEESGLYTIFKCERGGFTIKKITKLSDESFDIETYTSGDMGYRKPKYTYVSPEYYTNYRGERTVSREGYRNENYRKSVQQCYNEAFDFFTTDDKTGAYTSGKYIDIVNFPDLRNDYYYMHNTEPKVLSSSGTYSSEWWSSDEHGANIYWDDARVFYSTRGRHYELTLNNYQYFKDLLTYLSISLGLLILLLIIIRLSKPKYFRNLLLFGKRWKNTSFDAQILFFRHTFFGAHKFTEMIDDNIFKGTISFTDKGNTINLSYNNKELFYKIVRIERDILTITSLKEGNSITFRRIGSVLKNSLSNDQSQLEK